MSLKPKTTLNPTPPKAKVSWKKGLLKYAFLSAVSWGALGYYAPSATQTISQTVEDKVTHYRQKMGLENFLTEKSENIPPEEQPIVVTPAEEKLWQLFGEFTQEDFMMQVSDSWHAALGRQKALMQNSESRAQMQKWLSQFDYLKNKPIEKRVEDISWAVNRYMSFTSDYVLDKQLDYWAAPIESVTRGEGDVEDYALLKYHALRYVGVPEDHLYIAVVGPQAKNYYDHQILLVDIKEPNLKQALVEDMVPDTISDLLDLSPQHDFVILGSDMNAIDNQIRLSPQSYKPYFIMNANGLQKGKDWKPSWSSVRPQAKKSFRNYM